MKRLTLKEWDLLKPFEKEVLRNFNLLNLVKPKGLLKAKIKSEPKPYTLIRVTTCNFCKVVTTEYFRMCSPEENPYILRAKTITRKDAPTTERIEKVTGNSSVCKHCKIMLEKETKEELITRILYLKGKRRI